MMDRLKDLEDKQVEMSKRQDEMGDNQQKILTKLNQLDLQQTQTGNVADTPASDATQHKMNQLDTQQTQTGNVAETPGSGPTESNCSSWWSLLFLPVLAAVWFLWPKTTPSGLSRYFLG